jgi:ABC-type multidrug transport system permease subunit
MVLINITPEFGDISTYILINLGGWRYIDLSYNFIFFAGFYVVIMLLLFNVVKGIKFRNFAFAVAIN